MACGRIDTGLETIDLDRAEGCANLCAKCRQQIEELMMLRRVGAAPKPGRQLWFSFAKEW